MANLLTRVPKRALLSLSKGRRGHHGTALSPAGPRPTEWWQLPSRRGAGQLDRPVVAGTATRGSPGSPGGRTGLADGPKPRYLTIPNAAGNDLLAWDGLPSGPIGRLAEAVVHPSRRSGRPQERLNRERHYKAPESLPPKGDVVDNTATGHLQEPTTWPLNQYERRRGLCLTSARCWPSSVDEWAEAPAPT